MNWKRILCIFGHRYPIQASVDPATDNLNGTVIYWRWLQCARCGRGPQVIEVVGKLSADKRTIDGLIEGGSGQ